MKVGISGIILLTVFMGGFATGIERIKGIISFPENTPIGGAIESFREFCPLSDDSLELGMAVAFVLLAMIPLVIFHKSGAISGWLKTL